MIIFIAILTVIFIFLLKVTIFLLLSTILIGLAILFAINLISFLKWDKFASIFWNLMTVGVTALATALFWKDLFDVNVDLGFLPHILMGIYGCFALAMSIKPPTEKKCTHKIAENVIDDYIDYCDDEYDEDVYVYCKVVFDDSGKTYYYQTRDPDLDIGDAVYVPFGRQAIKKIGVIVSLEEFEEDEVPYPPEKTKFILGRVS